MKNLYNWQKRIYGALIMIALGIVFSNTMTDTSHSLGNVFIAIGGLFFISGMHLKRKSEQEKDK
jgi:drug/metabolite transporter superfamily protein YnfA